MIDKKKKLGFSMVEVLMVTIVIASIAFFIGSSISQGKKEENKLESRLWSVSGIGTLSMELNKWLQTRKPMGFSYDATYITATQLSNTGQDLVHKVEFGCEVVSNIVKNYLNSVNTGLMEAVPVALAASLASACSKSASIFSCGQNQRPIVRHSKTLNSILQNPVISYPSAEADSITKFKLEGVAGGICTSPLNPSDAAKPEEIFVSMQIAYLQGKELQILRKDRVYPLFDNNTNGIDKNPNVIFYASP